jgi:NADH-quinone oxidoreductase subunit G
MEAASLLYRLFAGTSAGSLCYFALEEEADQAKAAITHLNDATSASMADVQAADLIALVDCDLLQDGPMMALAVRQAWRQGAKVFMVGNAATPEEQEELPFLWQSVSSLSDMPIGEARKPVVICRGGKGLQDIAPALASGAKLACLLGGPNAFGVALLAAGHGTTSLARAVAGGKVKGIIAVEADIPSELLQGISFIAALDWRATETVKAARIVLPTTAWVEMDGTYINNEGRAQHFNKVMTAGVPIMGLDPAGHPPRHHEAAPPGGESRPAWQVVAEIIERTGTERDVLPLSGQWQWLRQLDVEGPGLRIWQNMEQVK